MSNAKELLESNQKIIQKLQLITQVLEPIDRIAGSIEVLKDAIVRASICDCEHCQANLIQSSAALILLSQTLLKIEVRLAEVVEAVATAPGPNEQIN